MNGANPPTHLTLGTEEMEWYTPGKYVALARNVLGVIDLDPASCPLGQAAVQAATYFTVDQDGLARPWHGRVWLNPPFKRPLITQFVNKLVEEKPSGGVKEAILLTNNCTETEWFQMAAAESTAICFPNHRIEFLRPSEDGLSLTTPGSPLQGQAVFYLGDSPSVFSKHFGTIGFVLRGDRRDQEAEQ